VTALHDGTSRRLGTGSDVAWIRDNTTAGRTIATAIPPVFESYATVVEPEDGSTSVLAMERALVQRLAERSGGQPWWLGFLDTGAHDIVFPDAPKVSLYANWKYVLVEAGPEQALSWRTGHMRAGDGVMPDLFFPRDRSWLVSALWDDTWTCVGGPAALIRALQLDPQVRARPVALGEDATPPGHEYS